MNSRKLFEMIRGDIRFGESMAKHTSWRVGGPADYWFAPQDKNDLATFFSVLPKEVPILMTGLGSNLLIRDGGVRGAVVCTHRGLSSLHIKKGRELSAGAGVSCAKVARYSARAGLSGIEFMAGIPGTVGGALAMNAGAYGSETWNLVQQVEMFCRDGTLKDFNRSHFKASYRSVSLSKNEWFSSVIFSLSHGDPGSINQSIRTILLDRSDAQPIGNASAGSVFRNPSDDHAARLIEAAGLKGRRFGGAVIST